MLLQQRQNLGKQLGLVGLGLGALSPGRMRAGTEWYQITLQRSTRGLSAILPASLGLWAFGEKSVLPQTLP